jgi:dimethylargininase
MLLAVTRDVSPTLTDCELTFLDREPVDVGRAREQQAEYRRLLEACGARVVALPADPAFPDCCFVEDAAVVVGEVAVLTRPGAESRRREPEALEKVLAQHRPLARIESPGTLDGGDVLVVGRRVFVGRTQRTNEAGADALRRILSPFGYEVVAVPVRGCLHLKTAVTAVDDQTLLLNPQWVERELFAGHETLAVPAAEPLAADVLRIGGAVAMHAGFPRTRDLLAARGVDLHTVDLSEFLKTEAGVTCLSVVIEAAGA